MNHLHGHPYHQDEEYIRHIRQGGPRSEQAMRDLYLTYRKRVTSYVQTLLKRYPGYKGLPEDLVHDAFIILTQRIEKDEGPFRSLFAYWMGICRLLFLNQLKKDERLILVGEPEEIYNMNGTLHDPIPFDHESLDVLEQSFDLLGDRCQQVLLMWVDGYPMQVIARTMGLSGDAMARKIKYDCFKKLKNLVKNSNKMPG